MMILIADSGSTKTDWVLVGNGETQYIGTQGISPIHQHSDAIRCILNKELNVERTLEKVFFYGSGCTPLHIPVMQQLLQEAFPGAAVQVHSDLLGAARALCGHGEGIASILGTGANSCLYDGERIVQNTPALGYILGDEGSGAVLGRMFMNAIFKDPAFADLRDAYLEEQQLTQADIIQRVYREPMGNRFLASTSLFIGQHIANPLLHQLVVDNFRQFFRCNIRPYQRPDLPVHFVGSMAHHYRLQLAEAAKMEGFTIGRTLKSPMEGLVTYHRLHQRV